MFKSKQILKIVVIIAMVSTFNLMLGCNNNQSSEPSITDLNPQNSQAPLFTAELSNCTVDVNNVKVDIKEKKLTLKISAHYNNNDYIRRILTLQFYETDNKIGYISTITNSKGNFLWEFDYALKNNDNHYVWFEEKTPLDSMFIQQFTGDKIYSEIYNINDSKREFKFNTSNINKIYSLYKQIFTSDNKLTNSFLAKYSQEDIDIIKTLQKFHEFYSTNNSLHYNRDGFLVADLLTNSELANWLENSYDINRYKYSHDKVSRLSKLCDASTICVGLKCMEGAVANPGCDVCMAASLTCVAMDLFNLW